jgi:hypothetical protein
MSKVIEKTLVYKSLKKEQKENRNKKKRVVFLIYILSLSNIKARNTVLKRTNKGYNKECLAVDIDI